VELISTAYGSESEGVKVARPYTSSSTAFFSAELSSFWVSSLEEAPCNCSNAMPIASNASSENLNSREGYYCWQRSCKAA
jgi:hypothetical protein